MSENRVTITEIAEELGLSRATVSKVLNNNPTVPKRTVDLVKSKASEMGWYKLAQNQSNSDSIPAHVSGDQFALLAHVLPERFHIASSLIASLEQELSKLGYSLSIHIISSSDIENHTPPNNLYLKNIEAIICIEMFDRYYSQLICALGKPTLFLDTFSTLSYGDLDSDIILMENVRSVQHMLKAIIKKNNIKKVGFIGDKDHCLSFRERYTGYIDTLRSLGLEADDRYSVIDNDVFYSDPDWLTKKIQKLPVMPDLFFCANDLLAMQTLSCLSRIGIYVPKDILLCGFDETPSLNTVNIDLTTVQIPSKDMAVAAINTLRQRIANPSLPFMFSYVQTNVHFRQSTLTSPLND